VAHVTVITPNPAIDITYSIDEFIAGATNRVTDVVKVPGGKGLNVARVLEQLGCATVSILPLGGESGTWLQRELQSSSLPSRFAAIEGDTRTTVTITGGNRHPTVLSEAGPQIYASEWLSFRELVKREIAQTSMLVISGSLPGAASVDVLSDWVRMARRRNVPVLADVAGEALLAAARAKASILKPNEDEVLMATGRHDLQDGIDDLHRLGASLVVVSRGANGLVGSLGGTNSAVPAIRGVQGNPTGAGDAATAGLVAALTSGRNLVDALHWASAAGAAAVREPIAGRIDIDYFRLFLSQLHTERTTST